MSFERPYVLLVLLALPALVLAWRLQEEKRQEELQLKGLEPLSEEG